MYTPFWDTWDNLVEPGLFRILPCAWKIIHAYVPFWDRILLKLNYKCFRSTLLQHHLRHLDMCIGLAAEVQNSSCLGVSAQKTLAGSVYQHWAKRKCNWTLNAYFFGRVSVQFTKGAASSQHKRIWGIRFQQNPRNRKPIANQLQVKPTTLPVTQGPNNNFPSKCNLQCIDAPNSAVGLKAGTNTVVKQSHKPSPSKLRIGKTAIVARAATFSWFILSSIFTRGCFCTMVERHSA